LPSSYWVTPAFLDWRRATERNPVSPGRQRSIGSARRRAEAVPDGRRQSRRVRGGGWHQRRSISRARARPA